MELEKFILDLVMKLVGSAITHQTKQVAIKFYDRMRMASKVEEAVITVIEPIVPFLQTERASDADIRLLFVVAEREMQEILSRSSSLFEASLDGQKLFDQRYSDRPLPEELGSLTHLYTLIFPRIANLVCALPAVTKIWELEGQKEYFRRMDVLQTTLKDLSGRLESRPKFVESAALRLLETIRQGLIQRVEFHVELSGLRADRPDAAPLEKLYVMPELEGSMRMELLLYQLGLNSPNVIVIKGGPGSGKSTFSLWTQRWLLSRGDKPVAFLYRLRDLARSDSLPSLLELIRRSAGSHLRDEVTADVFRQWASDRKILVILDGFDEVTPSKRPDFERWASDLAAALSPSTLIISSRPLSTPHLQRMGDERVLAAFDAHRVREYATKWYACAPLLRDEDRNIDAAALADEWIADAVLSPLVRVPLTLATVLMVHHIDGQLPSGRSKLYQRYTEGMLGIWDLKSRLHSALPLDIHEKRWVLMALALRLHSENSEDIGDDALCEELRASLLSLGRDLDPVDVRDHLHERSGLLVGPGTWSFVHKSVCEYFVAAALDQGDMRAPNGMRFDRLTLFEHRHNDRWNSVLFFWAGLASAAELQSFIDQVIGDGTGTTDALLAAGLILDQGQGHRLPLEWRRQRITKLLKEPALLRKLPTAVLDISARPTTTHELSQLSLENLPSEWRTQLSFDRLPLRSMANTGMPLGIHRLCQAAGWEFEEARPHLTGRGLEDVILATIMNPRSERDLRAALIEVKPGSKFGEAARNLVMWRISVKLFGDEIQYVSSVAYLKAAEDVLGIRSFTCVLLLANLLRCRSGREGRQTLGVAILERESDPVDKELLRMTAQWDVADSRGHVSSATSRDLLIFLREFLEPSSERERRYMEHWSLRQQAILGQSQVVPPMPQPVNDFPVALEAQRGALAKLVERLFDERRRSNAATPTS